MDRNKEYLSEKKEHEAFLIDQNHCCLCGTRLSFKHLVDFETLKIQEDADCPKCQIRLKTKNYSLQ